MHDVNSGTYVVCPDCKVLLPEEEFDKHFSDVDGCMNRRYLLA